MMTHKNLIEFLTVNIFNLFVALLVNLLAWQFKLVSGGLTGYALLFNNLTGIPVGTLLLGFNILLLILAYLLLGRGPGLRATYGFISLSFFIDFTRYILGLSQHPTLDFLSNFGIIIVLSIAMGVSVCFVLAANYSVGAYSTIYLILKKFINIKPATLFFILDFILAIIVTFTNKIEFGILLIINAVLAYFVVKVIHPKIEKWFEKLIV